MAVVGCEKRNAFDLVVLLRKQSKKSTTILHNQSNILEPRAKTNNPAIVSLPTSLTRRSSRPAKTFGSFLYLFSRGRLNGVVGRRTGKERPLIFAFNFFKGQYGKLQSKLLQPVLRLIYQTLCQHFPIAIPPSMAEVLA